MPKKRKTSTTIANQVEMNQASRVLAPVLLPLLELFSETDCVFTEEGAFSQEHIRKSLGRLHRQWKRTRAQLDPEFNPSNYEKKPRLVGTNPHSRLASDSTSRSSTAPTKTSEKSRRTTDKSERTKPGRSAKDARSRSDASGTRSNGKSRSGSGAGSATKRERTSSSG